MNVRIASALRSYTDGAANVAATGSTVNEILFDLELQFPGIRFRVIDEQGRLRQHMRVFVNDEVCRDLDLSLSDTDDVTLMQGLSGG
jgi:sulfur-carrier protein